MAAAFAGVSWIAAASAGPGGVHAWEKRGAPANAFFPFCIDWHDSRQRSFEPQAQMLKEPGIGGDVREHLARSLAKWQELRRQLAEVKDPAR
jgi:hypothetical protein